jgi:hypothetical protein
MHTVSSTQSTDATALAPHKAAPHTERTVLAIGLLILGAVMLTRARRYWDFTLDDAFITLRYAKHMAEGLGPSWNPGAEPMEGYTTALWMLLLGAAQALGVNGLWFAKSSGVLFALAAVAGAAALCRLACIAAGFSRVPRALGAVALFALCVAYWPLGLHAVSGMETTFSCLILTLFFLSSARAAAADAAKSEADSQVYWPLGFTALLATLTRPEAGLLCAVTLSAHGVWSSAHQRSQLLRSVALWFVLPGAVYLVVRWLHFGLLFPLSFYVKATNQPWLTGLPDVLGFFRPFVVDQPWWAALFVLGAVQTRSSRPALIGSASFALFFIVPEHIMAFEGRYLLPLFPLLAAIVGVGAAGTAQLLAKRLQSASSRRLAEGMLGVSLCALACFSLPGDSNKRAEPWLAYGNSLQSAHVALARDLAPARALGGRIALLDVGAIGYYADWYTVDTFGLNDAHVALTERKDTEYVLAKRPDLLVVVSAESGKYRELFAWETPLYEAARARGYRPLCEYTFDPEYHLQVLARPGEGTIRGDVCRSSTRGLLASTEP